jgi:hypothetical protein
VQFDPIVKCAPVLIRPSFPAAQTTGGDAMFMYTSMWWFWLVLMLIVFLPLSYGWGYRGWGVPYPSYIQRRRMERATSNGGVATFNHQSWGLGGDLIWGLVVLDMIFVAALVWWR